MIRSSFRFCGAMLAASFLVAPASARPQMTAPATTEGDFVVHNLKFHSGESLPDVRLHYTTLGKPARDAQGRTTNAVLILHGTGGSGHQFLAPYFAGELFGPGQLLDATRYFIVLPDGVGHGQSSKPSDGLHAHFPQYDYDDMVALHYKGRNRVWRKMVMDGIRNDPEWKGGDYTTEPPQGLRIALDFLLIAGSAPLPMQKSMPTRDDADKYLDKYFHDRTSGLDANDFLYQVNASRNYDPSPQLEKIKAPVMWINSGDDFINPPELGIAEREVKRLKNGHFILIPASEQTFGHGTHTHAALWKEHLVELLRESVR